MRRSPRVLGELRTAGPRAARHAKRLVLDRPDGPETARRIAERRTSDEGQAGLSSVRRAATPTVGTAARARRVTALLALLSAIFIGGADFVGGITSRTANGIRVGAYVAIVGLPMALAVSIVGETEHVERADVGWSVLAGDAVALGIGCFYIGMARGLISVVAPVAAVTGAVLPVGYALVRGERPGPIALVGLVIAFVAVAVVSLAPSEQHPDAATVDGVVLALAFASGVLFGLFYIAFSRVSEDAGLWPVTIERAAASVVLLHRRRCHDAWPDHRAAPPAPGRPADRAARGRCGRPAAARAPARSVAIASVVASLYPVTTVLLAAFVLRERLSRLQYVGVACALVSVALVSSG